MFRRLLFLFTVLGLAVAPVAVAQTSGSIDGTVKDAQGLVMPGVTVTLTGEAIIGEQVATTLTDGTYRFRALPPGTYSLRYALQGFQTLNREGIIVSGGRTITVNVTLDVATVAETITVTGESPVVDVKNTALSNEFDTSELQDVPSATDVWSVLGQTAGVRMRGYDVGGSHKSQQSGYESFGIRYQNRVLSEGVDSTEGISGTGFYYDYYSIEEFTTAAAGADVEMTAPGSMIVMTVKSGGNNFSGLFHFDYEDESFVSDNVDDELRARAFTGNPNLLFREFHADVGGPIVRDRAWFYGFYGNFKIDKQISGVDPNVATDIGDFDLFGGKITLKLTDEDTFIGYSNYQLKEKPNRGLSTTVPPESILAQNSWSWVHKAEWQRVWNDRTFSNVQVKHFGFGWPMVPQVDPVANPPRIDSATSVRQGAGWNTTNPPFTFVRWKPQFTATLNHYIPSTGTGAHDFKFGYDFQIDSSQYGSNANSGAIRYFDNSTLGRPNNVDEIELFSVPSDGFINADNRDMHNDFFAQDTWTVNERLTFNLGFRFSRQRAYYKDADLNPLLSDFFPTGTIQGQTLTTWKTWAPRIGVTYDLSGQGKTVIKGHYGRYYFNIADTLSSGNPSAVARIRYKFLDQNQNGLFDGAQELGDIVNQVGTVGSIENAQGTQVNPDLEKAFADEFSASIEHEIVADTSIRFSYVRKQQRNDYGVWNRAQQTALFERPVPFTAVCTGCPGEFNGQTLNLNRVPDDVANVQESIIDTFPGSDYNYDTVQVAFQRRFTRDFFVQASYDYQWRDEFRAAAGESQSPLDADPLDVGSDGAGTIWQNHSADIPFQQDNTNWQARFLARYEFPFEAAVSGNVRLQSGWPWAPIHRVDILGSGTQPIFLENIENNRSDDVTIVDLRVEKFFQFGERMRVSGMLDIYNLFNSNPETNFLLRTGSTFRDIIQALDPRALKLGVRFQF